ncbi:MAG: hypothetical protein V1750_00170 [Acidobacteriota bacterium]
MLVMLCRNRVADYSKWKFVFDSHAEAHRNAGLHLRDVWRDTAEPNNVFFLFEVASFERAQSFIGDPAAAEAGQASGVLDGEYNFLESSPGY